MFFLLLLVFYLSIVLLLVRKSILSLIFAWETLGTSSFLLIFYYINWNSCQGANLTILTNRWGDGFMILILFINLKSLFFFFAVLFILITKRAIYPFSSWLPAAMAAPTPVSALVHSRTLVTAGICLSFKYMNIFIFLIYKNLFMIGGTITILVGSFRALTSLDIKKIIAFTTLRQLGVLAISLIVYYPFLTIAYLIIHAILKRLLFILRGLSIVIRNSQSLIKILKNFKKIKIFRVFLLIVLNFLSVFCLAIFFVKEIILISIKLEVSLVYWILFQIILVLTCYYSARLMMVFFSNTTKKHTNKFTNMLVWIYVIIRVIFLLKNVKTFHLLEEWVIRIFVTLSFILILLAFNIYFVFNVTIFFIEKLNNFIVKYLKLLILEEIFLLFKKYFFFNTLIFKINTSVKIFILILLVRLFVLYKSIYKDMVNRFKAKYFY